MQGDIHARSYDIELSTQCIAEYAVLNHNFSTFIYQDWISLRKMMNYKNVNK